MAWTTQNPRDDKREQPSVDNMDVRQIGILVSIQRRGYYGIP